MRVEGKWTAKKPALMLTQFGAVLLHRERDEASTAWCTLLRSQQLSQCNAFSFSSGSFYLHFVSDHCLPWQLVSFHMPPPDPDDWKLPHSALLTVITMYKVQVTRWPCGDQHPLPLVSPGHGPVRSTWSDCDNGSCHQLILSPLPCPSWSLFFNFEL